MYRNTCEIREFASRFSGETPPASRTLYCETHGPKPGLKRLWFTFTLTPPKFWRGGEGGRSTRENTAFFRSRVMRDTAYCCLYSTLHYWLYQAHTNCRDFNPSDLQYLPVPPAILGGVPECVDLAEKIMERLEETSTVGGGSYTVGGTVNYQRFKPGRAKSFFDKIDGLLAEYYGFTNEELDFIINYDIKYRMGQDESEGDAA